MSVSIIQGRGSKNVKNLQVEREMVNPQATAAHGSQSKEIFFGCLLSQLNEYLKLSLGPPIIIIKRNFQTLHHMRRHEIFDEFPIWRGKIARHKRVDGLTNCCYYVELLEEIIAWPLRCWRALLCWETFFADDFREVKSEKWDRLKTFCGARMNHKRWLIVEVSAVHLDDWLIKSIELKLTDDRLNAMIFLVI